MRFKELSVLFCLGVSLPAAAAAGSPAAPQDAAPDWAARAQDQIRAQEYFVTWQSSTQLAGLDKAWHAPNRQQNMRSYFTPEGIRVVPRTDPAQSWEWGLSLTGYGRGELTHAIEPARLAAEQNRIEYDRGIVREWYRNEPRGLEQGFVLSSSPEEVTGVESEGQTGSTPVALFMELSGTLSARPTEDRQTIEFTTPQGARAVRYGELKVTDSRGRQLKSWFEAAIRGRTREVRILFDDAGADYPITVDPLATSPAWTAEQDQAGASFGRSASPAGDINGDGFSDLLVGAPLFDNGQTDEGMVFLYLGSASGLAAAPAWTAEGNQAGAQLGFGGTAGDVNGDGFSDLLVGASMMDNGQLDEGMSFLYMGSATGLSSTPAWSAEGNQPGAQLGSGGTAGDVNGDGYSDVIVAARFFDNGETDEGRARLYLGSASGLATTSSWQAEGNQAGAQFGSRAGWAGDINGDGFADVLVSAPRYSNGETSEGVVFLYMGSPSGLPTIPAAMLESNQSLALFGAAASTAGDVNGDGYSDLLVGSPAYDNGETDEGMMFLYLGSALRLATTATWTAESDQVGAQMGQAGNTAGDFNGDGYADVIVGVPFYDDGDVDQGRALIYLGSSGGLTAAPAWITESDQAGAQFGLPVATAGDVNGDGYSDVAVGAYLYDNPDLDEGRAYVYMGSATGPAATSAWTMEGNSVLAGFGSTVGTAGDVDGDGFADVFIAAIFYDGGEPEEGAVFVFPGSARGLPRHIGWMVEGNQPYGYFGQSAASAGDVNGDGFGDLIIGATSSHWSHAEGRALVYLGSALGLDSTPSWIADGIQSGAGLGWSVAGAGDVNGDGYGDVIVGAPSYDADVLDGGRALLYLGSPAGLGALPAWIADGDQTGALFGGCVATAGDVNGDGFADVIVSAPNFTNDQLGEGRAFIYYGSAAGLSPTPGWTAEGDSEGFLAVHASFGLSAAAAGDVNGDGFSDVIVGAPYYPDGQGSVEGRALLYLGSSAGLMATPAWIGQSNPAPSDFGYSVASAGDVNGDGFGDVIVGAPWYDDGLQADVGAAFVYLGSATGLAPLPEWTAISDQEQSAFGYSVGTAGDIDGDGYADLIVGSPAFANGEELEGKAELFLGSATPGLAILRQQRRADDAAPIALEGQSDWPEGVRLAAVGRSSMGRGRVRLAWEVKPAGIQLDGSGIGSEPGWLDTGAAGTTANQLVTGLTAATRYHWRVRFVHDIVTSPFQQRSRWLLPPWTFRGFDFMTDSGGLGDRVWEDSDGDGIQDPGEPGLPGALALLYDGAGHFLDAAATDAAGKYRFHPLDPLQAYSVRFLPPAGFTLTLRDQGGDDATDSDADPLTIATPLITPTNHIDQVNLDAGMIAACAPPDEPIFISAVAIAPGTSFPILHFQDANQLVQVTGYNIYRSGSPVPPPATWPRVASDVVDMDEAAPNKQWVDQSGNPPPGSVWYYKVTAYNHRCPAEGPF